MCGICGIINFTGNKIPEQSHAIVERMNAAITHRGPDSAGTYQGDQCSLAMRRLAIIDIAGGDQPLWNEGRSIGVFMNGEIYNHPELRKELQAKGHRFSTESDTEVLVHLYEEYGDGFVEKLRGMFAFCLYDLPRNRYLLARDRFGEKPLYYFHTNNRLSFSSEAASLLQDAAIPRILDREALDYYLASGYVPEPLTLVQGVRTLPPGHCMTIAEGKLEVSPYFSIAYRNRQEKLITSPNEAAELLEPLLRKAVSRQLVSDVPLGAFLSGGIDSSTICALAQAELDRPLDTFTVRFEEAAYDESKIARKVAERIGSNHHEITVKNEGFSASIFWEIIDHCGLPFPDSSAIPVYLITREIRKHVKVALSGDGGDEIFGGYSDLGWWLKAAPLTSIPRPLGRLGLQVATLLPLPAGPKRQLSRALRASLWGRSGLSFGIHRMQFEDEVGRLLDNGANRRYPLSTDPPPGFYSWTPLRQAMYYRINHKMVTDMLVKVDRMSMANSLEVRAPLLDPDLYNASLQLSDDLLFHKGTGKIMLRKIMQDHLPEEVFNHPKQGFSIPLHKYQNDAYRQLSQSLLGPKGPLAGLLNLEEVAKAEAVIFSGNFDPAKTTPSRASHRHWSLLLLAGWMQKFNISIG